MMGKRYRRVPMPVAERLTLSPWMKWRKYGRIPWKFLINMALTLLVTTQVSVLNRSTTYIEHTKSSLSNMFFPPDMELDDESPRGGMKRIYTYAEFASSLTFLMDSYQNLGQFVGDFSRAGEAKMVVDFADHLGPAGLNWTNGKPGETYNLHKPPFGPFDVKNLTQLKEVAGYMDWAEVQFQLHNLDQDPEDRFPLACWLWDIRQRYDFRVNSHIYLDFRMHWSQVEDDFCRAQGGQSRWWTQPNSSVFWITLSVMGLAVASLVLTIRSIARSLKLYRMARKHYSADSSVHLKACETPVFWESLTISDKLRFFNLWVIATMICNICCIVSSLLYLSPASWWSLDKHWWVHLIMGLGAAFAWVQNTQYFEFDKEMAIILLAMRSGLPYILRLVVAIGPVFIGYVLFGWTFFGAFADTFRSFGDSAVTLFCIVNGDDMHATFQKYTMEDEIIGRLFLISFVMCFIYCVLNVFIYIMEDAVHSTKLQYKRNAHTSVFGDGPDLFFDDQLLTELVKPFNAIPEDSVPSNANKFQPFTPPRSPLASFRSLDTLAVDPDSFSGRGGDGGGEGGSGSGRYDRIWGVGLTAENKKQGRLDGLLEDEIVQESWTAAGEQNRRNARPSDRSNPERRIFDRWSHDVPDQLVRRAGRPFPTRQTPAPDTPSPDGPSTGPREQPVGSGQLSNSRFRADPNEGVLTPVQSGATVSQDKDYGNEGSGLLGLRSLVVPPGGKQAVDDPLREPLLGLEEEDARGLAAEGAEEGSVGFLPSEQGPVDPASMDAQRLFVLDHIFEVQERMHMKHLHAFSARLAALEKDHQRSLAEVQQHFVDMVDRRLQRILSTPSGGGTSFRTMSAPRNSNFNQASDLPSPAQRNVGGSRRGSFRQSTPTATPPASPYSQLSNEPGGGTSLDSASMPADNNSQLGSESGSAPNLQSSSGQTSNTRAGGGSHTFGLGSKGGSGSGVKNRAGSSQITPGLVSRPDAPLGIDQARSLDQQTCKSGPTESPLVAIVEPEWDGRGVVGGDRVIGRRSSGLSIDSLDTREGVDSAKDEDSIRLDSTRTSWSEMDEIGNVQADGDENGRNEVQGDVAGLGDGWGVGRGGVMGGMDRSFSSRRWTGGSTSSHAENEQGQS